MSERERPVSHFLAVFRLLETTPSVPGAYRRERSAPMTFYLYNNQGFKTSWRLHTCLTVCTVTYWMDFNIGGVVGIQSLSRIQLFLTPWMGARQAPLSSTISQSLLKLMSIESVMPSNHLILCRLFFFLHSIFPSIRVLSNELALRIRWPHYLTLVNHRKEGISDPSRSSFPE